MDPSLKKLFDQHLGALVFALFLGLVTCFIAWYKQFFKLPKFDRHQIQVVASQVLIAFLIYFGLSFFFPIIINYFGAVLTPESKTEILQNTNVITSRGWIYIINLSVLFFGLMIYLFSIKRESRRSVVGIGSYESTNQNVKNFLMGMLTWVVSFPLVLAISQAASILVIVMKLPTSEQIAVRFLKSTMIDPTLFLVTSLFLVFVVPTIEEILFRGFLQNIIVKHLGRFWGILLNALIFALFHFSMSQKWGNIEIIPSLFVLACFLGFIYYRQNSIWASIGLHATFNGFNVIMMSLMK